MKVSLHMLKKSTLSINYKRILMYIDVLFQLADVVRLEADISSLRGECDLMVDRVTNLTGGKGKVLPLPL